MMGKNDFKYLFRSTCRKLGDLVLVLTGFPKELLHKDKLRRPFFKKISL